MNSKRIADRLIDTMFSSSPDNRPDHQIDADAADNMAALDTGPCAMLAEYLAGYLSGCGLDNSDAAEIAESMASGFTTACDNPEAANGIGYEMANGTPALLIRDDGDQGALVQHYENQPDSVPTGIDPF